MSFAIFFHIRQTFFNFSINLPLPIRILIKDFVIKKIHGPAAAGKGARYYYER